MQKPIRSNYNYWSSSVKLNVNVVISQPWFAIQNLKINSCIVRTFNLPLNCPAYPAVAIKRLKSQSICETNLLRKNHFAPNNPVHSENPSDHQKPLGSQQSSSLWKSVWPPKSTSLPTIQFTQKIHLTPKLHFAPNNPLHSENPPDPKLHFVPNNPLHSENPHDLQTPPCSQQSTSHF